MREKESAKYVCTANGTLWNLVEDEKDCICAMYKLAPQAGLNAVHPNELNLS